MKSFDLFVLLLSAVAGAIAMKFGNFVLAYLFACYVVMKSADTIIEAIQKARS